MITLLGTMLFLLAIIAAFAWQITQQLQKIINLLHKITPKE